MVILKCKLCNKEFERKHNRQLYCSKQCSHTAKNLLDRYEEDVCSKCGAISKFLKKDKVRVCSEECKASRFSALVNESYNRIFKK